MKLILGQFTQADMHALQVAIQEQQRYQGNIIMPYWGDHAVQIIELPRNRRPRKMISIKAHTMIKLVAIKPSAKAINFTRFAKAAKLGMQDAAEAAEKDIQSTAKTWKHSITITIKERADGYSLSVDDDVWNWLDKGTRAHRIIARRANRLRFFGGYRAKTRPGFIGSTSGGSSGGPVFRQVVNHPGTKARSWSKLIGAKYRSRLKTFISKRIKEAM